MILINSSPKDALKIFQPFLPIFIPVGIGCLIAAAERDGIKAWLIDEQVEDNPLDIVSKRVLEMRAPYIFGFSVLTAAFKRAITLSAELKKRYPESLIVFGGIHPTAMPEEVMGFDHIDAVIRGEGERPLMEFYRRAKEGKDYSDIPGLSYRKNGQTFHNPISPVLDDLDAYPPFPYHRFDQEKYDLGFIISSRGCPYKCIFCSNRVTTGKRYRYRSASAIADEIQMLYAMYNRRYILFLDDNFLVDKKRTYELIGAIRKRGLHEKMTFNFQARGDNVNPSLLFDLYDSGFRSIFFGIETASEKIMKTVKKGETVAQCIDGVKMAKHAGFHVSATFIFALPGETHKDRIDAIRLSRMLNLDMVRYNNATPYPGTELWEMAKLDDSLNIQGLYENFNSVSTFIENPFKKIPFTYIPKGNSEKKIRMDILLSYLIFYLNFKRIRSIFASPDKGVGWFNAGEKMLEFIKKIPSLLALGGLLCIKFAELLLYIIFSSNSEITIKEVMGLFKRNTGRSDF